MKQNNNYKIKNYFTKQYIKTNRYKVILIIIAALLFIILFGILCHIIVKPIKVSKITLITSNQIFLHVEIELLIVDKNELPDNIKTQDKFIQQLYLFKQMIPFFKTHYLTFIILSAKNIFTDTNKLKKYKHEISNVIKIAETNEIKIIVNIPDALKANKQNIKKLLEFNFNGIISLQPKINLYTCKNIKNSIVYKLFTTNVLNENTRWFGIEDEYCDDISNYEYFQSNIDFILINSYNINIRIFFYISNKPKIVFPSIYI